MLCEPFGLIDPRKRLYIWISLSVFKFFNLRLVSCRYSCHFLVLRVINLIGFFLAIFIIISIIISMYAITGAICLFIYKKSLQIYNKLYLTYLYISVCQFFFSELKRDVDCAQIFIYISMYTRFKMKQHKFPEMTNIQFIIQMCQFYF